MRGCMHEWSECGKRLQVSVAGRAALCVLARIQKTGDTSTKLELADFIPRPHTRRYFTKQADFS